MLLVSGILENAARVAPDAVAATLDDDALTFGEIDARGEPDRARDAARAWVGRGDRVLWWGDTSLEAVPVFAALAEDRRGVRAAERARVARRGRARRRVRPAAAAARAARRTRDAGGRARRRASTSRSRPTIADGRRGRAARRGTISTSATRTSSSSRAAAPAGRRASCSRTAPTGCARSWARPRTPGRRRHRVHVPAVPHGGLDDRARRVAGPPRRCTSCACPTRRRCCTTTARHRAARLYCIPAVWGRILEHGVGRLRPVGARRSRHRHVGDAARAARRDQGRAPAHRDPRVLRIDRGRARRSRSATPTSFRKPGQRRRRAARRRGAARRRAARCACAARSSWTATSTIPTRPPRRSSTAGTTPAISARSTTTATCRSSAGPAT